MKFAFTASLFCLAAASQAGQLASRADLNLALGGSALTDTFDVFTQPFGGQTGFDGALDVSTVVAGQGGGLVNTGVSYQLAGTKSFQHDLYLAGAGYFGLDSNKLLTGSSEMLIAYSGTTAMGLDVTDYRGFGNVGTMSVYGVGGNLLGTVEFSTGGFSDTKFLGWEDAAGIGSVRISGSDSWSPLIDNHEFGATPEPASMAALTVSLLGLAARKRRKA